MKPSWIVAVNSSACPYSEFHWEERGCSHLENLSNFNECGENTCPLRLMSEDNNKGGKSMGSVDDVLKYHELVKSISNNEGIVVFVSPQFKERLLAISKGSSFQTASELTGKFVLNVNHYIESWAVIDFRNSKVITPKNYKIKGD